MKLKDKKILVAYFSHEGQNYSRGNIIELAKGNTKVVAEFISDFTGADMFEIKTIEEYPFEYIACTNKAKEELKANYRPQLKENIDISGYDVIFLGYPNWWGTMPMAVFAFLENNDFRNKTILPFCTHEGSGMGKSEGDLRKILNSENVMEGLPIFGSYVENSKSDIRNWIKRFLL